MQQTAQVNSGACARCGHLPRVNRGGGRSCPLYDTVLSEEDKTELDSTTKERRRQVAAALDFLWQHGGLNRLQTRSSVREDCAIVLFLGRPWTARPAPTTPLLSPSPQPLPPPASVHPAPPGLSECLTISGPVTFSDPPRRQRRRGRRHESSPPRPSTPAESSSSRGGTRGPPGSRRTVPHRPGCWPGPQH